MKVRILGTRGIPAQHGGFETFAEQLSLYLVERDHEVTVYCQADSPETAGEDEWRGIKRVTFWVPPGPLGTILFDWHAARHARARGGVILTLGYNTACFSLLYTLSRRRTLMNMDGIEWAREKWSKPQRLWLRCNEFLGAHLSSHLIADHPEIGKHLQKIVRGEKVTVIPYGAEAVTEADAALLQAYGCSPHQFAICIARPEPENSILEIVRGFSKTRRGYPLLVLGKFSPETNPYHRKVMGEASDEIVFPGAIYDKPTVCALRFYARYYLHGHRVGGTNPSLVEALSTGSPIVAQRNRFNEWVAGPRARYFETEDELAEILTLLDADPQQLETMREASVERHARMFPLWRVHRDYERLLERLA
jgi:glycosyltransferase involved in cell wall biosynthesis